MRVEYENVLDDHLGKLHFTFVTNADQLFLHTGMSIWKFSL